MKTFFKKYGKYIAAVAALAGTLWLIYYLLRRMEYRFSDTFGSTFFKDGKTEAEVGSQSVIPQEFWGREVLVMNSPTTFMQGDEVLVTYDSPQRGAIETKYKILYMHGRSALVIDRDMSPDGGPWSGKVKLA